MASLPKDVVYVCKSTPDSYKQTGTSRIFPNILEAFPVDASNTKGLETAERWAKGQYSVKKDPVIKENHSNAPMHDVIILDMETRAQNGKVYKALVKNRYYVDLRPDVVLDLMVNGSIIDGVITSPMVWVRGPGGMKLTRVNSPQYIESESPKSTKKNQKQNPELILEAGFVYHTVNQLGNVRSQSYLPEIERHILTSDGKWPRTYYVQVSRSVLEIHADVNSEPYEIWQLLNRMSYDDTIGKTITCTYNSQIDDNKLKEFIGTILRYVSELVEFELSPFDPKGHMQHNYNIAIGTINLLNVARNLNMIVPACDNFDRIFAWLNTCTIVRK